MSVNLAFIIIEVRFGCCFKAKICLVTLNFLLVSGSLMKLNKFVFVL